MVNKSPATLCFSPLPHTSSKSKQYTKVGDGAKSRPKQTVKLPPQKEMSELMVVYCMDRCSIMRGRGGIRKKKQTPHHTHTDTQFIFESRQRMTMLSYLIPSSD